MIDGQFLNHVGRDGALHTARWPDVSLLGQLPELKQSSRRTAQVSGDRAAGYPQPQFAIEHDKVGQDTRWYSNLYDGLTVECNQGGSGS